MNKATLRDILFEKYFQIEDGVLVSDLLDKLSFIPNVWKELHLLCEKNIKYFYDFSSLKECKMLEHNQRRYLILKLKMWEYVIIDVGKMQNITQIEFENEFDEKFFVDNFDEIKEDDETIWPKLYRIEKYNGDIKELINFYIKNQKLLSLSSKLHCRLDVGDAWTWFYVDFINANVQMGFQTPNQFLYEQLFLRYDLTACRMQDAQQKMGIEKMKEIFNKMNNIKIPKQCIPSDLYQQYLIQCNLDINKQIVKKL